MTEVAIKIKGMGRLNKRLSNLSKNLARQLPDTVFEAVNLLKNEIKSKALSGQILKVQTGVLRRSVKTDTWGSGKKSGGKVGTNIVYAPIHEFGGRTGRNHASKIPARRPFSTVFFKNLKKINKMFSNLIRQNLRK